MSGSSSDSIRAAAELAERLRREVARVVVGQQGMVARILIALLASGHVLLEGVPGLAKTLTVSSFAAAIRASFQRIQFTPDLLPADLLGTLVYDPRTGEFEPKKGPIFAHLILADEINRAPAKVQSALLEAMQERQVTLGDETWPLPAPFLVLATQNPVEQEGTYPLPEAQVDRFMLKVLVDYPSAADELEIMDRQTEALPATIEPVASPDELLAAQAALPQIRVDPKLKRYLVAIVQATRQPASIGEPGLAELIEYGASPRATIYLNLAARAHALLDGRGYVMPEDIKAIAYDVLRHRLILSFEAEADEISADELVRRVLASVPIP